VINVIGFKYDVRLSQYFSYISKDDKAELFSFQMYDNNYNLVRHSAVLDKLGIRIDFDERNEDYQKIYETSLESRRKDIGKGRER
jgi:hypothetical protein